MTTQLRALRTDITTLPILNCWRSAARSVAAVGPVWKGSVNGEAELLALEHSSRLQRKDWRLTGMPRE